MLQMVKGRAKNALKLADATFRRISPAYRAKRKYKAELAYWREELEHLRKWHEDRSIDWWGIPPVAAEAKVSTSTISAVNAVMTMHSVRPNYLEELQLGRDALAGQTVLEVGCGPLAPLLQFSACVRHGVDPLINLYLDSGWPLYDYDAKFVSARAERMPYANSYFDAVISVNALDHVDDFRQAAAEIQRVVKVGGSLYFEIEYHSPTVNEPQKLNDDVVLDSFRNCELRKVCERGKREMFQSMIDRFGLIRGRFDQYTDRERFVTWHGRRIR
jgi:SAM-dependent methyltransferase